MASPRLHQGQTVTVGVSGEKTEAALTLRLFVRVYGEKDQLEVIHGPQLNLGPDDYAELQWTLKDIGVQPIAELGIEFSSASNGGCFYLDFLSWQGEPHVTLTRPELSGTMWRRAWVQGVDTVGHPSYQEPYRLIQNRGTGLLMQGTRDWRDYRVTADVTPHMVKSAGIAVRVQGMRRYYALLLGEDQKLLLVKVSNERQVLAEVAYKWELGYTYAMTLQANGNNLKGCIDGEMLIEADDSNQVYEGGAIALVCEEGRTATQVVTVEGLSELTGGIPA